MASTITSLSAGNACMTEQCIKDFMSGTHKTTDTYKLVLLDLSLGSLTLTQSSVTMLADITSIQTTNTSGSAYTAGGITLTSPTVALSGGTRKGTLSFTSPVSLNDANFTTDAWAIINTTSTGVGSKASPVLAIGKFDTVKTPSGTGTGNFQVTIPADVLNITASAAV